MERKHFLDVMRGFALLFMIFGHICRNPTLQPYILGACLPLFFFISGVLSNIDKKISIWSFITIKFKKLIIPFVFFYLLTFLYWLIIERNIRGSELSIQSQLFGLIYGSYSKYMYFNGALWFLPCLFSLESICFILYKLPNKLRQVAFLLFFLVGLYFVYVEFRLPWGIDWAMFYIGYFMAGFYLRSIVLKDEISLKISIPLLLLSFGVQILSLYLQGHSVLLNLGFGKNLLFGFATIVVYYILSRYVNRNKILEYIGANSLVIFAFQEPLYRAFIFLVSKILKMDIDLMRQNAFICLIIAASVILILTPAVWFYNQKVNPLLKKI